MAKPNSRLLIGAAVIVAAGAAWWILHPRQGAGDDAFTGYVVSDNIYMTSPVAGTLASVAVSRGQRIEKGAALFRVDPTVRQAMTDQARAQTTAASAAVAQQQAALGRAQADAAAAQAEADSAHADLSRLTAAQAAKAGSVAALDIDRARAAAQGAVKRRDAARTQIEAMRAAIAGAQAQLRQAQAGLASAQRELDDLAPPAPSGGRVEDVMYRPRESVAANAPIVSIVPDGEVKVRFYVPQNRVADFKTGRSVAIACDGCADGLTATVDFVASRPEYTPPVIYSLDARQKLAFMVEAKPANPAALTVGQPMDVAGAAADLPRR